jgi:hypothetical protein
MPSAIVLAITADNAEALVAGNTTETTAASRRRSFRHARISRSPASDRSSASGCSVPRSERPRRDGALPVSKPRRYGKPRRVTDFGLAKVPRSFKYVER